MLNIKINLKKINPKRVELRDLFWWIHTNLVLETRSLIGPYETNNQSPFEFAKSI